MRIAVIGGGIGGLAAAALLAKDGHSVEVFEKNESLGGRAGVLKADGFTFDLGPSWYLMPDVFERFFAEFGLDIHDVLDLRRLDPSHKMFFEGGESIPIRGSLEGAADAAEQLEPGSRQAFLNYVASTKKQYDLVVGELLYRKYESPLDLLIPQALKAAKTVPLLGSVDGQISRRFKSDKLRKMLEYSMVFLGTSPYDAPALYSMMAHVDFGLGVSYPMGGITKLIEALVDLCKNQGVKTHVNTAVEEIVCQGGTAKALQINGKRHDFDLVISNADMQFTETKLLPSRARSYTQKYWDSRVLAPSGLLLYLGVKGELPQLAHHTLYFAENWREHFDSIFKTPAWPENPSYYVCAPSKTDPSVAPKNHENLFVFVPIAAKPEVMPSIKEMTKNTLSHIARTLDIPDLKERIVYQKAFGPADFVTRFNAQGGTALGLAHTLSQTAIFRPHMRSRKLSNLYYVGAGVHPGIGMPTSIISAQVLRDLVRTL